MQMMLSLSLVTRRETKSCSCRWCKKELAWLLCELFAFVSYARFFFFFADELTQPRASTNYTIIILKLRVTWRSRARRPWQRPVKRLGDVVLGIRAIPRSIITRRSSIVSDETSDEITWSRGMRWCLFRVAILLSADLADFDRASRRAETIANYRDCDPLPLPMRIGTR